MFIPGTERGLLAGSLPASPALPTSFQPGWPTGGVSPTATTPTDSQSLPMFNITQGSTDTGVGHSGDLGGAGAR